MPSPQQTEEPTASLGTVGLKIQRPPPLQTPQYAVASAQPTYSYPAPNHRPVNQSAMNYPQANCPQHQVIAAQPAHLYFGPSRLIDDPVGTPPFVYPRETLGKQDTPYASGPSGYSAANVLTAITAQRHLNYASSPIGITSSSPREPTPSATPYPAAGPMADNHVFNKINTRIQPSASANGNSKTLQFINYNDETAATGSHMSQEASKKKSGRGWKYDISRIKTLQSPTAASPPPSNILAELPKSKRSSRYDASAIRNLGKDITAASKPPHIEIPKKKTSRLSKDEGFAGSPRGLSKEEGFAGSPRENVDPKNSRDQGQAPAKIDKLERNRQSAKDCRARKRKYIHGLEMTICELRRSHIHDDSLNKNMISKIEQLERENRLLKSLQAGDNRK